jgi:LacI family transcriptional regulator
MRAAEDVAARHQFMLVTGSTDEDPATERELVLNLCQRRVDGLIIVPAANDHRYLLREIELGTAVVFIDRPPGRIRADLIVLDNVSGARQAVEHLIRQGHRRIAMVGDRLTISTQVERFKGYREALEAHRLKFDESLFRDGAHDVPQAQAAVTSLLSLRRPPTALFTANNIITIGALRAMRAREQRIALVGFDDFEMADMLPTPVTVVRSDAAELGRQAAELLFARLGGDHRAPQKIVLPTELVVRGSGEM